MLRKRLYRSALIALTVIGALIVGAAPAQASEQAIIRAPELTVGMQVTFLSKQSFRIDWIYLQDDLCDDRYVAARVWADSGGKYAPVKGFTNENGCHTVKTFYNTYVSQSGTIFAIYFQASALNFWGGSTIQTSRVIHNPLA